MAADSHSKDYGALKWLLLSRGAPASLLRAVPHLSSVLVVLGPVWDLTIPYFFALRLLVMRLVCLILFCGGILHGSTCLCACVTTCSPSTPSKPSTSKGPGKSVLNRGCEANQLCAPPPTFSFQLLCGVQRNQAAVGFLWHFELSGAECPACTSGLLRRDKVVIPSVEMKVRPSQVRNRVFDKPATKSHAKSWPSAFVLHGMSTGVRN